MRPRKHFRIKSIVRLLASLACSMPVFSYAGISGQTSIINMPDARVGQDGDWRIGFSHSHPYQSYWSSLNAFHGLEVSGRYTRIIGIPSFANQSWADSYGDYKDKSFDFKFKLWNEGQYYPSLAVGMQDFLGTEIFGAKYIVASKKIGDIDTTLGYGKKRIDGMFGGLRYTPKQLPGWSFLAEYDAYDYVHDYASQVKSKYAYKKGVNLGVEYRYGWLTAQASYQRDKKLGLSTYLTVPLQQNDFIPKFQEPTSYINPNPRPTEQQWLENPESRQALYTGLYGENFTQVKAAYINKELNLSVGNSRISNMSRAVGRALRVALQTAPIETQAISITYTQNDLPTITYRFTNFSEIIRYLNGEISQADILPNIKISYANPSNLDALASQPKDVANELSVFKNSRIETNQEGQLIRLKGEGLGVSYEIKPRVDFFFNDPSGAVKYDLGIASDFAYRFNHKLSISGLASITLYENISDVTNPSNSALPHVRTDIAEYKKGSRFKLRKLTLDRYYHLNERLYARTSAGFYEEMFGGVGGQILYTPEKGRWAADLSVDWVKQRDYKNQFKFLDYNAVTALASIHYRLPYGITSTLRAGQFLAKDKGVRFELSRRFNSGIEMGFWYTITDKKDTTLFGPNSDPYYDKGIYLSMPFTPLLTKDGQASANIRLSPWTRDVGQMVASPGDLYRMLEKPLMNDYKVEGGLRLLSERPEPKPEAEKPTVVE